MKITEMRNNIKAAKGVWMKNKIDFYALCKTKFDLTNAEIASIMGIPESSVLALSKMIKIK